MARRRCANTAAGTRGGCLQPSRPALSNRRPHGRTRPRGGNPQDSWVPVRDLGTETPDEHHVQERTHVHSHNVQVRTALVVGGGIAGPVAATALLKAGIDATVYEAYPGPAGGIGGGLALAPNGLAALDLIGADDAVRALATAHHGHGR